MSKRGELIIEKRIEYMNVNERRERPGVQDLIVRPLASS